MRNLLIAIILILWILLGFKMCNDYERCCGEEEMTTQATTDPVVAAPVIPTSTLPCDGIICFEKNECSPRFCEGWAAYRDSILNQVSDGQKLVITGYARQNEKGYASLGQCRADSVKFYLENYISNLSVQTTGKVRVGISSSSTMCDRIAFDVRGAKEQVVNSTLIYFPFNSTNKLADSSVETYLDQVAAQVQKSGQKVKLTGHTDNIGRDAANIDLGMRRANIIKRYLISKGVSASSVIVDSKGESQPVASNDSDEGRAKNRRTELQIID